MILNFDFLADLAGLLGFLLSLGLSVRTWLSRRTAFDVEVLDYNDNRESARFLLAVKNRSESPLVISAISAFGTTCELEPKKIRNDPTAWNGAVSARLPIRVRARDIEIFYIELLTGRTVPLSAGTQVTFQIQTIARSVPKTVPLGNRSHYLNRRE